MIESKPAEVTRLMDCIDEIYHASVVTDEMREKLVMAGAAIQNKFEELAREFNKIRMKNDELERVIQELYANLDKQKEGMIDGDIQYYRELCADIYEGFWDFLDSDSQEFYVTAHFFFDKIRSKRGDFSPVIIEFCRIFENELKTKIYSDYIDNLSLRELPILDLDQSYNNLTKAVKDKRNKGSYFLSFSDMIIYLGAMRNSGTPHNGYNNDLRLFLENNKWDTEALSDSQYENRMRDYVNDYRNEAAHPHVLDEHRAERCKEKTKKLIKQFVNCKRSSNEDH